MFLFFFLRFLTLFCWFLVIFFWLCLFVPLLFFCLFVDVVFYVYVSQFLLLFGIFFSGQPLSLVNFYFGPFLSFFGGWGQPLAPVSNVLGDMFHIVSIGSFLANPSIFSTPSVGGQTKICQWVSLSDVPSLLSPPS